MDAGVRLHDGYWEIGSANARPREETTMDFNFTDEQTMLRESVQRYLADTYTFDARMGVVNGDAGWNPAVWQAFAA